MISGENMAVYNPQLARSVEGSIVVAGRFSGWGDFDPAPTIKKLGDVTEIGVEKFFIAKYGHSGDYRWAKNIKEGYLNSIAVDSTEAVYIAGSFYSKVDFDPGAGVSNLSSFGGSDIYIAKYVACSSSSAPQSLATVECNNFLSPGGTLLTYTGIYLDDLTSVSGCDSVITINLTLNHTFGTIVAEDCSSYTAPDSVVYTSSGIQTAILSNSIGCDSIITIYLKIKNTRSSISKTVCDSYTAPDGAVYTSSGSKTAVIPNAAGCDSTIRISLTIRTVSSGVSLFDNLLIAGEQRPGAQYKWLGCNNNFAVIEGETGRYYTVLTPGSYAVEASISGCIDTSACVSVIVTDIARNGPLNSVIVYPNPVAEQLVIDLGNLSGMVEVEIFDLPGQLILRKQIVGGGKMVFDFPVASGVYFLRLTNQRNQQTVKIVKE